MADAEFNAGMASASTPEAARRQQGHRGGISRVGYA
jgi:hypothetical protein